MIKQTVTTTTTTTTTMMISQMNCLSLLLLIASFFTVDASSFQEDVVEASNVGLAKHDSLRGPPTTTPERHVIRRIYGPENGAVRHEISKIEESIERSRTGFRGDPNHIVPYRNHPFDSNRRLDEENAGDDQDETSEEEKNLFRPLRIHFSTDKLEDTRDGTNGAKIDFIMSKILPPTKHFWSSALSVVPVEGRLQISTSELASRRFCGDSEFTEVPASHISTGVDDTDLILYISGTDSTRFCGTQTLAVAVACNFDQFDRPTAGAINFCLNQITLDDDGTASETVIQDNVDVAIHEAAHILAMSSNSYRFFWDPVTGKPRTPRPFSSTQLECVDGVVRQLILPADDTMKFFTAANGQRYASIVTPKVRTVARNQFNCQSLAGAQLENQPTGSQSCTGDHWDERLFYPEALSGVISPTTNIVSHLTLALMEDSGWYKANYTISATSPWGLNAGCNFVTEPCLVDSGNGFPEVPDYGRGYFCDRTARRGCSPALTHRMACTVHDYSLMSPRIDPPNQFQYFQNNPSKGGPRQADYCPVFGSTYYGRSPEQLSCITGSSADPLNLASEDHGPSRMCFESSTGEGRCYEARCILDDFQLQVNVRGKWYTCEYDFQRIEVETTVKSKLTCPRLSAACPDMFCPANCAGRGVCNYGATVNGTVRPRCECFDPEDTSAGCSDSLVLDGKYLKDSSGLIDNFEDSFFDPLVSVFVDDPDTWTTESWAWASAIFVILLLMILCICSSCWPQTPHKGRRRR